MNGRKDIIPTPEKRCEICGKIFQRKRLTSGTLEDRGSYMRRRFCSLSCANSRPKGGNSRTRCHVRARENLKKSCASCGSTENLCIHHADENWANNNPENLQTLCKHCHSYWHITRRLNGVKPSGLMPEGVFR